MVSNLHVFFLKTIHNLINDIKAIAFGVYAFVLFIFFTGVIYLYFTPMFNGLFDVFNIMISQNMVGEQTATNMIFIKNVVNVMVVFILFGAVLWAWVRSLEKKYTEG